MTEWRPIEGYVGIYEVSDDGRVRRVACVPRRFHMQEQVPFKLPNGYWTVRLRAPGKKRINAYLHRLVADAFIPNPSNLPEVNHDDGNKDRNEKDNLIWSTRGNNNSHKNRVLLTHHNQTDYLVKFPDGRHELVRNMAEFCDEHHLIPSGMSAVARGLRTHHHGFSVTYMSRKT